MDATTKGFFDQILMLIEKRGAPETITLLDQELRRLQVIQRLCQERRGLTPAAQLVNQEYDALVAETKTLQTNLDMVVEALRFYAERTTYLSASLIEDGFSGVPINNDKGQRARDAIANLVSSYPVSINRGETPSDGE